LTRFALLTYFFYFAPFYAQNPQAAASGTDRIKFVGSIRDIVTAGPQVASGPSATLERNELTQTEATATLEFSVALKMRDFAELQNRVSKGEIISFDEMAAKYYPTAADSRTVVDLLIAQGFAVKPPDKYSLSVFAAGSVAQIERAFETKFVRVKSAGVEYSSAMIAPSLSVSIAGPVLGVNGLQPHIRPIPHSGKTLGQPQALTNNLPPYKVSEIASAYNAGALPGSGAGQKIGIVIDTFPASSDLTTFWTANVISQSLNNIEKVQVVSGTLPSPSVEATLDVEWSSGMASGAKVRVYATKDFFFVHLDQAYQAILNDLPSQTALHQISLSYGLGETYESTAQMQTDDQYFAAMAARGVTVFVSSGDGGAHPGLNGFEDTSGPRQVEAPANDPNVTAVGGTSLYLNTANGAVNSESAWSYGGGGSSQFFARPSWQQGTGVPTGAFRLVPDVALVADINTGGYLVWNGQVYFVGGTSWGAPTWAGFCARINQVRANSATPSLGLLGPKLYPLLGSSSFRHITTGSNGPNGFYNAGPAFDLCTGIGVPKIDNLIAALEGGVQTTVRGVAKDFNSDGTADLVWENSSTGGRVIWTLRNCAYTSTLNLPTVPPNWHIVGVGDFLGNGQSDLVFEDLTTGKHAVYILNNGVFNYAITLPTVSAPWHIVGAGDFNGDGFADLVWENSVTGQRVIWLMVNGAFSSAINLPTAPPSWHIAGVGDFRNNGQSDLIWENLTTGQHVVHFLSNGIFNYAVNLPTVPTPWHVAGVGDFNGDGFADIVWENSSTGGRVIWVLVNGAFSSAISLPAVAPAWHIVNH
jgi:kumamolisin